MILIPSLASCQSGGLHELKNTDQPTIESVSTTTPLPPSTPTAVLSAPESEPSPPNRQCLTQLDTLPKQDRPVGYLILGEYSNGHNYFSFDLESMNQKAFAANNDSLHDLTISPNHTLMLYSDSGGSPRKKVIANLKGEIAQFPHSDEWASVAWLDDEHLVLGRTGETPDSTIRIYNFLTGENNNISLSLPNLYYSLHPLAGIYIPIVSVNPDLTRVVFFDMQDGGRIIFWDNTTGTMLASLPYLVYSDPWYIPAVPFFEGWSADGKQFITTSPLKISDATREVVVEELFRFDFGGQITQLTRLSDTYRFVRISGAAPSPDGKTIAFWLEVSADPNQPIGTLSQQLVVLHIQTGKITDLCLSYGKPFYSPAAPKPIWSPDGKYLIVETRMPDGTPRINLLNLEDMSLFVLQEGYFPVGWIISP